MRGPECPLWIDFVVKVGDFDAGRWRRLLKWILRHFLLDAGAFDRWKLTSGTATRGASLSLAADEERAWQAGEDSVRWRRACPLGPWATPGTAAHGGGTPQ